MTPESLTPSEIVLRYTRDHPVDLDGLAEALGLIVRRDPSLPADISGRIERAGPTEPFLITINGRHSHRRQRFTLAHEIGHYVLHRDLIGDGLTDNALYRGRLNSGEELEEYREIEANRYAADLLMPSAAVRAEYRGGKRSYAEIAGAFDVSPDAARIRLKEVGLGP